MLGGGLAQAAQPVLVQECELVKDVLNVLIGVMSATFPLCQVRGCWHAVTARPLHRVGGGRCGQWGACKPLCGNGCDAFSFQSYKLFIY